MAVESADPGIQEGVEVHLVQKMGPVSLQWHVRHEDYQAGRSFRDRQLAGPFAEWVHHHRFEPAGDDECDLVDQISYQLPLGGAGNRIGDGWVRRELERTFRYRHEVTRMDLETHRLPERERLVIAITGATGLIGSALVPLFQTAGHEVRTLSRGRSGDIRWDPEAGVLNVADLEGVDAIVHLAGEPIAQRWTLAARRRILESRTKGTRMLADAVVQLRKRPSVFVSISGANAYGVSLSKPVTETDDYGDGFLAEVCREWESASAGVEAAGIRRVIVRSGMVLSPAGGALAKMLPAFRAGAGGPVGRGKRWMSWIAIEDLISILAHAVLDKEYRGILNGCSPQPVRNGEFARTLGACLRRPAIAPLPPGGLRLAFGQMAEETLLSDLQVLPRRLETLDYSFRFPELRPALEHLLGKRSQR